jgi:hypothetical protein
MFTSSQMVSAICFQNGTSLAAAPGRFVKNVVRGQQHFRLQQMARRSRIHHRFAGVRLRRDQTADDGNAASLSGDVLGGFAVVYYDEARSTQVVGIATDRKLDDQTCRRFCVRRADNFAELPGRMIDRRNLLFSLIANECED